MSKAFVKASSEVDGNSVPAGDRTNIKVLIGAEEAPNFAMRKFCIEAGGSMPLHRNLVEHEQYVLSGSAKITINDEEFQVKAGDVVYIPAEAPHSYQNTGESDFEFLCLVPNKTDELEILEKTAASK